MEDQRPFTSTRVRNPEQLAEAIRSSDLDPCQLSRSPLESHLAQVQLPNASLDLATMGPAMLFTGATSRNAYTLVFVKGCPEVGRNFNFQVDHQDGYLGLFPPGGLLDAYTPKNYSHATLTVPAPVFHQGLENAFPEMPDSILQQGAGLRIGPAEHRRLATLVKSVEAAIDDPEAPLANPLARRNLERELLDEFFDALRSGIRCALPKTAQNTANRLRHLAQARDFVQEHSRQPLQIDDLCGATGMSKRGIERMFRETMGIVPSDYIRHQRLHGVRRTLLAAEPNPGVVKEAALNWGFWHMGHFARSYRKLFGECPSETLARSAMR